MHLDQAKYEIEQSKKVIEKNLDQKLIPFSYPNGIYNSNIIKLVRKYNFSCAVTVLPKLVNSNNNIYKLNRINAYENFPRLKAYLCGLFGDLSVFLKR